MGHLRSEQYYYPYGSLNMDLIVRTMLKLGTVPTINLQNLVYKGVYIPVIGGFDLNATLNPKIFYLLDITIIAHHAISASVFRDFKGGSVTMGVGVYHPTILALSPGFTMDANSICLGSIHEFEVI